MTKLTIARKTTIIGNSLGVTLPMDVVDKGKYYKITFEPIEDLDELMKLQSKEKDYLDTLRAAGIDRVVGKASTGQKAHYIVADKKGMSREGFEPPEQPAQALRPDGFAYAAVQNCYTFL